MTRLIGTTIVILLLTFVASSVWAEEEAPSVDEQAEDFAKQFKKEYKKMTAADQMEAVDKLIGYFNNDQVTDKGARKSILDAISKATIVKDNTVVAHVMKKSEALGEEAVRIVLPVLNRELAQKVPDESVYGAALGTLGKIRSENKLVIKTLTKLLKDKDDSIVGLATRTIAGYADAPGSVRKELFEEVLKATEGVYSGAQSQNQTLERKWNIIGDDVKDALSKLSGTKLSDPAAARKWFNDNKKKSWDPEPKKE